MREPSPSTRREGGATAAALAHAPTELPSSVAASPSAPSPVAAAHAAPAARRGGIGTLLLIVVLVAGVSAYGAWRLLPTAPGSGADVSAALGDAAAESGVTSANDALDTGTSTAAPLPLTDATDPSDAIAAGGADASDAAADADAMTNRTPAVPLDEFADPWARPAPTASVR